MTTKENTSIHLYTHKSIEHSQDLECDVCIVGSGAGGGTLAAGLVEQGLDVIVLESGQHRWRKDFDMNEAKALQELYQEGGLRTTEDLAISIMQGHNVGGGTTINWTTCFRTPERILKKWKERHGVHLSVEDMIPHWEAVEKRLNIHKWHEPLVNENNRVILNGCEKLGWESSIISRNVKGCLNSGFCGMGCPADAKQGMLVTYIPDALRKGLRLYTDVRATRFESSLEQVEYLHATVWNPEKKRPTSKKLKIRAKSFVSSAGAINGPALFLRSGINDHGLVGKRTFFHPVVGIAAKFEHEINGFYGAPQSASSHQFVEEEEEIGFFLEAAPTHPILAATAASKFGASQQNFMSQLSHMSFLLALHVDGYADGDDGGQVSLHDDGRIRIDYPISPKLQRSFLRSHKALFELALAAGSTRVNSLHLHPTVATNSSEISALENQEYGALHHGIFTAHQMGGLPMGRDATMGVVNDQYRHHRLKNLFVVDGSIFPTSLGVNPSLTIYGLAHRARQFVGDSVG